MTAKLKRRSDLLNLLCRICGQEAKNSIPVFGESGKKQGIPKKIQSCLPVIIEESDTLPKQICLTCLPKLDATWELYQLCKEGQIKIEQKLHSLSRLHEEEKNSSYKINLIEEKIRSLTEHMPIIVGESAIISLAPSSSPPPVVAKNPPPVATSPDTMMVLPEQVMIVEPSPVAYQPVPVSVPVPVPVSTPTAVPVKEGVYPECLIQVNPPTNKQVLYRGRQAPVPAQTRRQPAPKPIQAPTPRRTQSSPRRRTLREGDSSNVPQPKKSLQMCKYCNKTFPDDIIDHHVNLHLRQSFFTCIDCNKNFRSEQAMSRHRCGVGEEPINLDPDDEPICL